MFAFFELPKIRYFDKIVFDISSHSQQN